MRVIVVGGGPAGCAAAVSCSRAGADVEVLDSGLAGREPMAGEWLHPAGIDALDRLGIGLPGTAVRHRGFIVHPGVGEEPLVLNYPRGFAASMPHAHLVRHLQTAAANHARITRGPQGRVLDADRRGNLTTMAGRTRVDLAVGADGRASTLSRSLLSGHRRAVLLSQFAGAVLDHAALPTEGYGHIFLGAPGPVLAYRLNASQIRVFLDVPLGHPPPPAVYDDLLEHYPPALPPDLRDLLAAHIAAQRLHWAANRFQRRTRYRHGRCVLVGDAVGHSHPLAAHGMTAALLDGEALGHFPSPGGYARHRTATSCVSEQVSVLAHRAFCHRDQAANDLRTALFDTWRATPTAAGRAMALLGMDSTSLHAFAAEFARLTTRSLRSGHLLSALSWLDGMLQPQPVAR